MMRVSGRGNDGRAKPLEINDNGGIKTDDVKRYILDEIVTIAPGESAVVADLPVEEYRFIKFAGNVWADSGLWQGSLEIACFTGEQASTRIYRKEYVKISGGNIYTPFNGTFHTVDDEEIWGKRVEVILYNRGNSDMKINRKDITLFKASQSPSKIIGIPFNLRRTIGEDGEIPHLADNVSVSKVLITADINNVGDIRIAPSPVSPSGEHPLALAKPLQAGQWTSWEVRNLRFLGARGSVGDVLYVEGVL